MIVACALLVAIGFALLILQSLSITLVQLNTPDRVRGRVMTIYSMLHAGADTAGNMVIGAIAVPLGPLCGAGSGRARRLPGSRGGAYLFVRGRATWNDMSDAKRQLRQLPPQPCHCQQRRCKPDCSQTGVHMPPFAPPWPALWAPRPTACFLAASGRTALYTLLRAYKTSTRGARRWSCLPIPARLCPKSCLIWVSRLFTWTSYRGRCTMQTRGLAKALTPQTLAVCLIHPFRHPPTRGGCAVIGPRRRGSGHRRCRAGAGQPLGRRIRRAGR